jgi:hypothetical protein
MHGKSEAPAGPATPGIPGGPVYQIRLRGQLGPGWAEWFGGLTVTLDDHGDTLLTGPVADQAALYGVLKRVRDVGLPLLAVNCLAEECLPEACPPGECVTGACVAGECQASAPGATAEDFKYEEQSGS